MTYDSTGQEAWTVEMRDNDDGSWTVLVNGEPGATIIPVPTDRKGTLSIDVQPTRDADVDAIAFGAAATFAGDRLTMGAEPNGHINPGARPFVCVNIRPRSAS